MPYIGVSPFNGVRRKHTYTATASQTSFSGAGTEGSTLTYKDSTFVDVFQNGVKLGEADYTSTSGTAIVLAQGASLNDIVEVVVYDVFSVADTVSKADGGTFDGNVTMGGTLDVTGSITGSALTLDSAGTISLDADSGSINLLDGGVTHAELINSSNDFIIKSSQSDKDIIFKGVDGASLIEAMRVDMSEGGKVGIGTTGPTERLSVVNSSGDVGVRIQGNTRSFKVEQNNYGLRIYDIDASSERFRINAAGIVTTPLQPAFLAKPASQQSNVATGSAVDIVLGTEIFDNNADFSSNTFTAPVTGRYQLNAMLRLGAVDTASEYYLGRISTSNRNHDEILDSNEYSSDLDYYAFSLSVLTDMDAGDTAKLQVFQNSGTAQTDIDPTDTRFSGYLVC